MGGFSMAPKCTRGQVRGLYILQALRIVLDAEP